MGVPLFSETPISPPKSLTSYRSVGEIWWFCPPSNFPHIGEQKKTQYLEISRLCGLTGNEAKMPIRWGWDHCSRKKKNVLLFHTIKLDWNLTYLMEEVNSFDTKERQPFWKIPFCWDSSLFLPCYSIFYSCYFKFGKQQLPWFCSQFWKNMSTSFSTPNFFSNKPILYQQQQQQQLPDPVASNSLLREIPEVPPTQSQET